MEKEAPVKVVKSYSEGKISLRISLKCRGFNSDSAKIDGKMDITIEQARLIANEILAAADASESKLKKERDRKERRKEYVAGEVAAGRIVVLRSLS